MIKAVFFDIDGTLLDHGHGGVMPASTQQSLFRLREKGVKLLVATGRFPAMVTFMEEHFPFDGFVTMNGQLVFLRDGTVIHRLAHDPGDIRQLVDISRREGFPSLIIEETEYFYTLPSPAIDAHFLFGGLPVPQAAYDTARLQEHPVLQFLIYAPEDLAHLAPLRHIYPTSAGWVGAPLFKTMGGRPPVHLR